MRLSLFAIFALWGWLVLRRWGAAQSDEGKPRPEGI